MSGKGRAQELIRSTAIVAVLLSTLTAVAFDQEKEASPTARVRVIARCGYHFDFRKCQLKVASFKRKGDATNLASYFWFGSAYGVPYGTYEANMYFADAWPAVQIGRVIEVSQPDVRLVVDLRPQPEREQ